jgi:hypothetical protein
MRSATPRTLRRRPLPDAEIVVGGEVSWRAPAEIGERRPGLRCADLFNLNFGMFARRGHQRCHCNEEGFGTLSRQLGNNEGYRSSRAAVSGCFTCSASSPRATGFCVLLNYLICRGQQRFRDGEAERVGGLEVDGERELGRLLDR